jgi:hypothetical protein
MHFALVRAHSPSKSIAQRLTIASCFYLTLLAFLTVTSTTSVLANSLDNDLQVAIINSKALGNTGASVQANKTNAVVSTYRVGTDSDDKCKIKAILVSKALFDKVSTLVSVDVTFVDASGGRSISMNIQKPTINEFVSGRTKKETLLSTISVHAVAAPRAAATGAMSSSSSSGGKSYVKANPHDFDLTNRQQMAGHVNDLINMEEQYHLGIPTRGLMVAFQEMDNATDPKTYAEKFDKLNSMIRASNNLIAARNNQTAASSPVVPGPYQRERNGLWAVIQQMKMANADASGIESAFKDMENVVPSSSAEAIHTQLEVIYGMVPAKYRRK